MAFRRKDGHEDAFQVAVAKSVLLHMPSTVLPSKSSRPLSNPSTGGSWNQAEYRKQDREQERRSVIVHNPRHRSINTKLLHPPLSPRTSDLRPPEADLLEKARERGVRGIAKVVGHRQTTSINALRNGLVFSKPHAFRNIPLSANSSFSQSQSQLS